MTVTLAEQIEAVALGLERGDRKPASAGRRLREIAEKVRLMEVDAGEPVPNRDGMDGTGRLCRALYGRKERAGDYVGGSDCRMLHDAADRIAELERQLRRLKGVIELKRHAIDRWIPCPDHRDKVPAGECQVCRAERAERQLRLNRDGWHKIPPYGYVPDEAQAPYIAGPVAEEGDER